MDGRLQQLREAGQRGESSPTHLSTNEQDAFNQGKKDREKAKRRPEPTPEGGAGIIGLVALAVIVTTLGVILAIAVSAGIAAFGSAVLLYLLSRVWPGMQGQGYWEAYRTTFFCLFAFIVLVAAPIVAAEFLVENLYTNSSFIAYVVDTTPVVLGSLLTRLGSPPPPDVLPLEQWLELVGMWRSDADRIAMWAGVLLLAPPAVGAWLVAAARIRYSSTFATIVGSLVVSIFAILPGAMVAIWGTSWLIDTAQLPDDFPGVATLGTAAVASAVMVLAYALLGAFITGLALLAALKLSRDARDEGFGRAYGTSLLGLAACGVITVLAFFLFRGGDALWVWSAQVASAESFGLQSVDFASLWQATLASWPVLVPGLVVAGAIICSRHPSPFAGVLGYAGAVVLSAATAVPILVLCIVASVKLANSGVLG